MAKTIKAYVRYNDRTNTHYYRNFEIVDRLPLLGEYINDDKVVGINKVELDCSQGRMEVYDYDYYEIVVEYFNLDDEVKTDYYYYAVERKEND